MPPPPVDYLRIYPGLNDFTDALDAIPQSIAPSLTHLKEIDAKVEVTNPEFNSHLSSYFSNRTPAKLKELNTILDKILPAMERRMQVASLASESISREVQRLETDYQIIRDNEIPQIIQKDPNDPAFLVIHPPTEKTPGRSARREAREARESREARETKEREAKEQQIREREFKAQERAHEKSTSRSHDIPRQRQNNGTDRAVPPPQFTQTDQFSAPLHSEFDFSAHTASNMLSHNPGDPNHPNPEHAVNPFPNKRRARNAAPKFEMHDDDTYELDPPETEDPPVQPPFLPLPLNSEVPPVVMPLPPPPAPSAESSSINTSLLGQPNAHPHAAPNLDLHSQDPELQGIKRKKGSAPKTSEPVYCYCEKGSFGEMVGCDGDNCEREWFHLGCIGLSALPKGQWFCAECRAKLRKR